MRCLDTLLPVLAKDFGHSVGSVGGAASAYAFSYSAFQLVHGPLGDRVGAYRVVTWAAFMSALAALACSLAPNLLTLVGARFVAGGIAAAIGPLTLAWVSRSTLPQERPLALARMTAAAILGTAAGQSGGGIIGGFLGWPLVFVALALLFTSAGAALLLIARNRPELLQNAKHGRDANELSTSPAALIQRPAVARVVALVGVEGFAIYISLTYVGALLSDRLGLGPGRAGLIVALYGLGGLGFVLTAPRLFRTLTTPARSALGGAMLGVGFVTLAIAGSVVVAAVSLFTIGFGFLMLHNVLQVMASNTAPEALGTSLSMFAAASCLSQALGAGAGGFIFDRAAPVVTCLVSAAILAGLGAMIGIRGWAREG
ncbi:MAG: MFS transporter [Pseudomonadota bacterium]|nr:MFS transporter [Pseudomonadota bacterium]